MSDREPPPLHFNPFPNFGLRVERVPNVALCRGGDVIAYLFIDPKSSTGRHLFRPWFGLHADDIIVHANDLQQP